VFWTYFSAIAVFEAPAIAGIAFVLAGLQAQSAGAE
jgi:hypothetical protein